MRVDDLEASNTNGFTLIILFMTTLTTFRSSFLTYIRINIMIRNIFRHIHANFRFEFRKEVNV